MHEKSFSPIMNSPILLSPPVKWVEQRTTTHAKRHQTRHSLGLTFSGLPSLSFLTSFSSAPNCWSHFLYFFAQVCTRRPGESGENIPRSASPSLNCPCSPARRSLLTMPDYDYSEFNCHFCPFNVVVFPFFEKIKPFLSYTTHKLFLSSWTIL